MTFLAEQDTQARKVLAVFVFERQQHRLVFCAPLIVAPKAGACSSLGQHQLRERIARNQGARTQKQKNEPN